MYLLLRKSVTMDLILKYVEIDENCLIFFQISAHLLNILINYILKSTTESRGSNPLASKMPVECGLRSWSIYIYITKKVKNPIRSHP